MHKFIQNAVVFVRSSFILGIIISAIFGVLLGKNVLLYGYLQGIAGVIALVFSRGMVFLFQKTIETWAPGTWGDLTREVYEGIPIVVKLVIAFQYITLFYIAFVLGWFVFSIIYFWMK